MDWLLILDMAADGGALAFTGMSLLFGYRAATIPIDDDTFDADLHRQSSCGTYAGVAGALAVAFLAVGLMAF